MQKLILTPEECGALVPHWHELDPKKLNRLARVTTRQSRFDHSVTVASDTPILIVSDGYIVNGKHRAYTSFFTNHNQEAYRVFRRNDLLHHVPRAAFGDMTIDEVLESYDLRSEHMRRCKQNGVYCVADLKLK